ncbi:MAG TPA: M50 family metallopeptidase [Solirubrobacteraceae bacterium]|jgi:regulator of sigma E protease
MSWLIAFAGFAALVVLHEAGHFLAAKAVGMRVEKFSLFFGPMFAKFTRGETTYGIGPIPLGGYVKISGMNPAEEIPPEHAHRAYYRQPVWKRIVVIVAGPVVNIVLAFLILWILFWSLGTTEYQRTVRLVTPGTPAAAALQKGDVLVAVDGRRGDFEALRKRIGSHTCAVKPPVDGCRAATPARVTVERDGRQRTFSLRPVYSAKDRQPLVGFAPAYVIHPVGPVTAAGRSLEQMWLVTTATVKIIGRIFEAEQRKQLSGVVGSYEATRQGVKRSATDTFLILALISLSLGVINLFPFLPLDGGHIFWALAEKVRGRPISFRVMERASVIGIALVLMLFVIGLNNDVNRLIDGGGFGAR